MRLDVKVYEVGRESMGAGVKVYEVGRESMRLDVNL